MRAILGLSGPNLAAVCRIERHGVCSSTSENDSTGARAVLRMWKKFTSALADNGKRIAN